MSRTVKVVLAGHMGVGKSSILYRFDHDDVPDLSSTVGASFARRNYMREGEKLTMDIWDTAGQERFYSIAPMYFRNANCCIFVFDVTDYESFMMINKWMKLCTDANCGSQLPTYFLVGNKVDMKNRVVDRAEICEYCRNHNIYFYVETSAHTGEGVRMLEQRMVEHVFSHNDEPEPIVESVVLNNPSYNSCSSLSCY